MGASPGLRVWFARSRSFGRVSQKRCEMEAVMTLAAVLVVGTLVELAVAGALLALVGLMARLGAIR